MRKEKEHTEKDVNTHPMCVCMCVCELTKAWWSKLKKKKSHFVSNKPFPSPASQCPFLMSPKYASVANLVNIYPKLVKNDPSIPLNYTSDINYMNITTCLELKTKYILFKLFLDENYLYQGTLFWSLLPHCPRFITFPLWNSLLLESSMYAQHLHMPISMDLLARTHDNITLYLRGHFKPP